MSEPHRNADQVEVLASLYIEALRQGTPLWFRIASGSMRPLLDTYDEVFIEPAQARSIIPGEIAAFETPEGLVVHRILRSQESNTHIRLLQMADAVLRPSWIEEQAVVGRVIALRRDTLQVDLRHPIAKWWGRAIARTRYQLYSWEKPNPLRLVLRVSARVMLMVGSLYIHHFCRTSQ